MVFPQKRKPFTYAEYVQLSDGDRYEMINGKLYNMAPLLLRNTNKWSRYLARSLSRIYVGKQAVYSFLRSMFVFLMTNGFNLTLLSSAIRTKLAMNALLGHLISLSKCYRRLPQKKIG